MSVLLFSFILISSLVWGQAPVQRDKLCVVVSGKAKDHNNFLDEKLFSEGEPIAGERCAVFGSWDKAIAHVQANLKPEGKLMIIQGAHGNSEGSYNVNEGPAVSAETIHRHLKALSEKYHVGSVIHSCFSAAVMNRKLVDDELPNPRLDKLCLVSSSSFGRLTYSHPNDIIQNVLKLKKGENLETAFMNNRGGVISSAAWSEIRLPQYLASMDTKDGYAAMMEIGTILNGPGACSNLAQANYRLCVSPGITDTTFQDVKMFMDPTVPEDNKGFFDSNFKRSIQELEGKLAQSQEDPIPKMHLECKKKIYEFIQGRFGEKLKDLVYYPQLMMAIDELKEQAFFKSNCPAYEASLKDDWDKASYIADAFTNGIENYKESLNNLQRKYTKRKFDGDFDLYEFADAAFGEKQVCSPEEMKKRIQSKEGIVQSLFGMNFLSGEYSSNYDATDWSPDEMIYNRPVSTQVVLKGFQNAAILKPDLKDQKDILRRKACREFSF